MAGFIYRQFATQAELDAAYDVEGSVPDFRVYARQYVAASEATRRRARHVLDVRYGPTLEEYADLFPAPRRGAPIVIFIHGGYWRILSAREFSFCAEGLQRAGCAVVVASHSLCPKVTIGEIVRQMRALVAWTVRHADRIGGDPEDIWIVGHSAGGHLAAMCALADWPGEYGLSPRTVRGIVGISGVYDLEPIALTFLQKDLRLAPRDVSANSPQALVRRVFPAMLYTYGGDEPSEFARQSEDFAAAWMRAGNRASYFPQIVRNHFTAITDLAEPDAPLTRAILDFIGHAPRAGTAGRSAAGPAIPSVADLTRRSRPR